MQINGDIQNIKQYIVKRLEALYELSVPIGQLSTHELNFEMLEVTRLLGREVAVYLNRQGKVLQVSVGDTATVDLPEFKSRRAESRLTGIRCIHTHPSGDTRLSEPDRSSLRRLRFDCMAAIGFRDDKSEEIVGSLGFFTGDMSEDGTEMLGHVGPLPERTLHSINLTYLITMVNKKLSARSEKTTTEEEERAILAGLDCGRTLWPSMNRWPSSSVWPIRQGPSLSASSSSAAKSPMRPFSSAAARSRRLPWKCRTATRRS
nr:hypothetical protein [uncultured Mitsuokella sp.]